MLAEYIGLWPLPARPLPCSGSFPDAPHFSMPVHIHIDPSRPTWGTTPLPLPLSFGPFCGVLTCPQAESTAGWLESSGGSIHQGVRRYPSGSQESWALSGSISSWPWDLGQSLPPPEPYFPPIEGSRPDSPVSVVPSSPESDSLNYGPALLGPHSRSSPMVRSVGQTAQCSC